jgi:hypothetical protein
MYISAAPYQQSRALSTGLYNAVRTIAIANDGLIPISTNISRQQCQLPAAAASAKKARTHHRQHQ